MKVKIPCGIAGLGWWGGLMADRILCSSEFELRAFYDPDITKQIKSASPILRVESYEKLIALKEIHVIFIFSPNAFHQPQTIAALEAGKHVYVDKPVINNPAEREPLLKAYKSARNLGLRLAVGHNVRHYEIFKKAKELVMAGDLGQIQFVSGMRSRQMRESINESSWRYHLKTCRGGPLVQMGIHIIDTIQWVTDQVIDPTSVRTIATVGPGGNPWTTASGFTFGVKGSGLLYTSYESDETFSITLKGEKRSLTANPFSGLSIKNTNGHTVQIFESTFMPIGEAEDRALAQFSTHLRLGSESDNPSLEESLNLVDLVEIFRTALA